MDKTISQLTDTISSPLKVSSKLIKRNTITAINNTNTFVGSLRNNDDLTTSPHLASQPKSRSFHLTIKQFSTKFGESTHQMYDRPIAILNTAPTPTIKQKKAKYSDYVSKLYYSLLYCQSLLKTPIKCSPYKLSLHKPLHKAGMKTLAFGLENTLITCQNSYFDGSTEICVTDSQRNLIRGYIKFRPYTKECLTQLSKHFEIIIFTAASQEYAQTIAKLIDPDSSFIDGVVGREHCNYVEEAGQYIKDLSVLGRDVDGIVLIDDCAFSFILQPQNGIPLYPYLGDDDDEYLKKITSYLLENRDVSNIRERINETYRLHDILCCSTMSSLKPILAYYDTSIDT